jgi:hypothetical protein
LELISDPIIAVAILPAPIKPIFMLISRYFANIYSVIHAMATVLFFPPLHLADIKLFSYYQIKELIGDVLEFYAEGSTCR